MTGSESNRPTITDRKDALWFLESADVPLPEGLTVEKIRDRGAWWALEEDAFSFQMERHPTELFWSSSPTRSGQATPARWHVRKRYHYDLETHEWEITKLSREFDFDPVLLVDAEFDRIGRKDIWDAAIARVQTHADPETALEEEFATKEEFYRHVLDDVPNEDLEAMLDVLERAFRERVGLE